MANSNNVQPERPARVDQTESSRLPAGDAPVRTTKCRYFRTQAGCRKGSDCPFRHESADMPHAQDRDTIPSASADESNQPKAANTTGSRAVRTVNVNPSMVVARPVPKLEKENPRAFQIQQIKKRFPSAKEEFGPENSTVLKFDMDPSDPDFPFDIGSLKCILRVPPSFPRGTPPTLRINNFDIDRGYQINIENWFSTAWNQSSNPTLFGVIKAMDKRLEEILTAKKSDTVKIVPNFSEAQLLTKSQDNLRNSETAAAPELSKPPTNPKHLDRQINTKIFSKEQIEEAQKRRQLETQALEHRLHKLQLYSKNDNGASYTVPLKPRKEHEMPLPLRSIDSVRLLVPWDYNNTPCSIELLRVDRNNLAASSIESAFHHHVEDQGHLTLLSHVNWLAQNMHSLAAVPLSEDLQSHNTTRNGKILAENQELGQSSLSTDSIAAETGKEHIRYVPRPPEWVEPAGTESDDSDDLSYSSDRSESNDNTQQSNDEKRDTSGPTGGVQEKGILLSFPHLELYGVELLELVSVNVTVKCARCKDASDIIKIQNHETDGYNSTRSESCKKCAFVFGIAYRKDLMHSASVRAGYLDMDGCTPVDLLPSNFIPTCSGCSTPYPKPGISSVRGDASIAVCRECHQKMSFKLTEVKFLHVGVAGIRAPRGLPLKKKKEVLGIVVGQELPKRGKCKHYGKSYRWFRFSCCRMVYPCDKCHDEASPDHPNEFATRMICGFCSREQNYRPEDCSFCKLGLTGKAGTGFWEGGKGTRDPMRMSRKDPRKYKRRPGSKSNT